MTAVDFAAFVDRLATVSGEAILPFFRTSLGVENKGGPGTFDPVTAADRAAETAMRTLIRQSFPDHGIIGEEFGNERTEAEYCWVLDPIDGTKSFIAGMPASGHVDLVIETELKPYDILPLVPIILGAGGIVTGWDGGPPTAGGRIIADGDSRVHEAAMALLNK